MTDEHAQVEEHISKRFDIHEFKGQGAYGIVWKATDKVSKQSVALKKVFDAFQNATDAQRTYREVVFLQQLTDHENIVKLHNVIQSENQKDLYMVFEYMETDLHKVIRANLLNSLHKQYIIYQLLKSLKYIHSGELIHRDLKPSNLLIDAECQLKVADFGLARSLAFSENDEPKPVMTDYVATRWYRAPEILFGSSKYSKAVDMWSVGCILGEMIIGKAIFAGSSSLNQIEKVIELIGRPKPDDIEAIDAPSANQILQSQMTNKKKTFTQYFIGASDDAIDFLRNLLVFNPNNRMSVDEALNHKFMKEFKASEQEKVLSEKISIPFNDNIKYTIKEYREALYQGMTTVKRENRQQLQTLHNTIIKQKEVISRPNIKSQSFHSQPMKDQADNKDDYMSQTQSLIYAKANQINQYKQKSQVVKKESSSLHKSSSYNVSNPNEIQDKTFYSNKHSEELPAEYKLYMSKQQDFMGNTQKQIQKVRTANTTDNHSKDNSRSISQSDEIKRNQIISNSQYNFNHYHNSKALYNKYNNKLNQIRQSISSNTYLVQRQSKSNLRTEVNQKVNQLSSSYVKTSDFKSSKKSSNHSTITPPQRSKSYENQGINIDTSSQFIERSRSKQQTSLKVNSPFNSELKYKQKAFLDGNSNVGLCMQTQYEYLVLSKQRVSTQPNVTNVTIGSGLKQSQNSVQQLLARCTNSGNSKNPSYGNNSASKATSYINYSSGYKPKTHNKSNSYMDVTQMKLANQSHSFNYFEKQLHVRNSSIKDNKMK